MTADRKRIVCFTLTYPPYVGGAEIAFQETARRLRASGKYEFTIITARFDRKLPGREKRAEGEIIRAGIGIPIIDKYFYPWFAASAAKKTKPDLVFVLLESFAAYAGIFHHRHNPSVPAILNTQSGDTEEYVRRKLGPLSFLHDRAYSKHYRYTAISEYLKRRCISHGIPAKQVTIIPNGVDTKRFIRNTSTQRAAQQLRRKLGLEGKVIFTASRLTLKNGVDDTIKAFALLRKKADATLVIAGRGEDEKKLRALSKDLGVDDRVLFLGHIDYDDLPAYYVLADVFIRPSLSEGFGNSFVEALSCGTPIIGTPVGGIPDFLEDGKTGLFVKVRSPRDIAEKLQRLLEDRKLSKRIAVSGRKMVEERYTWDRIAEQYDKLFRRML